MVEYLHPIAKIADLEGYVNKLFEAKSDLTGFSAEKILLLDYKTFHFKNEHWGIGTGETCNVDKMLERKDELLKAMNEEKKKENLQGIIFLIVDIIKQKTLALIPGENEEKVAREAFKTDVKDNVADLGSRVSRKKQIIPPLEKYFNSKS
jgi:manganese-dependent inorganic pyrophosphatase